MKVGDDDRELQEASARARKKLLALKPKFRDGAPELQALVVKAPFETASGGAELMWVEVIRWRGGTIEGILQSRPFDIPTLEAGAKVTVAEDDVFDYVLQLGDGGTEGGETNRILEGRK